MKYKIKIILFYFYKNILIYQIKILYLKKYKYSF